MFPWALSFATRSDSVLLGHILSSSLPPYMCYPDRSPNKQEFSLFFKSQPTVVRASGKVADKELRKDFAVEDQVVVAILTKLN